MRCGQCIYVFTKSRLDFQHIDTPQGIAHELVKNEINWFFASIHLFLFHFLFCNTDYFTLIKCLLFTKCLMLRIISTICIFCIHLINETILVPCRVCRSVGQSLINTKKTCLYFEKRRGGFPIKLKTEIRYLKIGGSCLKAVQ